MFSKNFEYNLNAEIDNLELGFDNLANLSQKLSEINSAFDKRLPATTKAEKIVSETKTKQTDLKLSELELERFSQYQKAITEAGQKCNKLLTSLQKIKNIAYQLNNKSQD